MPTKLSTILGDSFIGTQGLQGLRGPTGNPTTIPQNFQSTSYTLQTSDIGNHVSTTTSIIIPSNTFSIGDVITIFNRSTSTISISASGVTMIFAATNITSSPRSLAAKGLCTILCVGNNEFVLAGPGLS